MIEIKNINKSFEDQIIFKDFSLDIKKEEILVILGSSGVGKSTLLNILSKVDREYTGEIIYDKEIFLNIDIPLPVVFQEFDQLFPWFNIKKNILLPFKDKKNKMEKFNEIIKYVGLEDSVYKYPVQLSGGMKQRTSIARALICDSKIVLMDEPFGSLDFKMRKNLQNLIKSINKEYKKTIVFITHDVEEAIFIADRVIILKKDQKNYEVIETGDIDDVTGNKFYEKLKIAKNKIQED